MKASLLFLAILLSNYGQAADASASLGLHFERMGGGIAEDGFDIHCGKPNAGSCEVLMLDHGKPQESATVTVAQAHEWIEKFVAAAKKPDNGRSGRVVISVTFTLDGKAGHADLTTEDRKAGSNPYARAFTSLETKLRDTVAATP